MEQALIILETLGCQVRRVQTSTIAAWPLILFACVLAAAGVIVLIKMAPGGYKLHDRLMLVFFGLALIVCAGFVVWGAIVTPRISSRPLP